jgi:hypothetical protein
VLVVGERTVSFNVLRGRGRQSGADVAMSSAALVKWRDGRAVFWKTYAHRDDVLQELDISEDALDPIAP